MPVKRQPALVWYPLSYQNGWEDYNTFAGGSLYPPGSYAMHPDGMVELRGFITKTTTITLGSQIAVVPAPFAPLYETWFPVTAEFGTGNRAAFMCLIGNNGALLMFDFQGNAPSGGGFPGTYVSLNGGTWMGGR